jgi:PTS system D-glucosamine-specific IIA component/PTS system glucose-specific IIA component
MFGFLKKKKEEIVQSKLYNLVSAVNGRLLSLSEVPDPVFAEKMAGDGVAIDPTGDIIVAPADGELTLVFNTKHAFALTLDNGIELLVHVGIDTVSLQGEGFEQLAEVGIKVKAGTPILKINRDLIRSKGLSLITPILITNPDITSSIVTNESIDTIAGETVVLEYCI